MTALWWLIAILLAFSGVVLAFVLNRVLRELRALTQDMSWIREAAESIEVNSEDRMVSGTQDMDTLVHQMWDTLNDFSQILGRLVASEETLNEERFEATFSCEIPSGRPPDSTEFNSPHFNLDKDALKGPENCNHDLRGGGMDCESPWDGEGRMGFESYLDPYFDVEGYNTENFIYPEECPDFQQNPQNSPCGWGHSVTGPGPSELESLENLFKELFGYEVESMSTLEQMRFNVFKSLNSHLIERQYFVSRNAPGNN